MRKGSRLPEIQNVIDEIETRIATETKRVLPFSATELAEEFGVSVPTITGILYSLGAHWDGYFWFMPDKDEDE
jgi:DNA-binding MurR/RpiR family transcriptional regulator